ncbi:MAG TPA: peptidase C1 [Candidatus Krumholzibacteria bacterium]|nr:peptidase C1 [Candidatus Krumholzibacteria bacterium]
MRSAAVLFLLSLLLPAVAAAQDGPVYREPNTYPVLDEIRARRDSLQAVQDARIEEVRARQDADAKARKEAKRSLRVDWSAIEVPQSPDAFDLRLPHLPPVAQYMTGTCWAFAATSLMESEAIRLSGHEVKLSEMWTVYWEYVLKTERWVREYGRSPVSTGSQSDGLLEVYARWGAVPQAAYAGVLFADGRHDHDAMHDEITAWLDLCEAHGIWDRDRVVAGVRAVLDAHLGAPPASFRHDGRTWTPLEFRADYLKLDPSAYVALVSRLDTPFGAWCLLDVPDNWRRAETYLNVPLADFTRVLSQSLDRGYTCVLGGDNSEPGMDGQHDAAVIPSWDIPAAAINQGAREHRIVSGQTGDDHGIHVVGKTRVDGAGWYLIKDSNRSSRLGRWPGYYFWREEYPALKMLTVLVHRDMVADLLPR